MVYAEFGGRLQFDGLVISLSGVSGKRSWFRLHCSCPYFYDIVLPSSLGSSRRLGM